MFRELLAHPQEVLYKRHAVYYVCVMSVGCTQLMLNTCNIPSAVCLAPPEDEQVTLETCRGASFLINWMKSPSRWFHYTGCLQKNGAVSKID
jgi:hypothetical protein